MVVETTINNGRARPSDVSAAPTSVGEHIGELAEDLLSLSELQVKLLVIDARAATRRAMLPLAVLLTGGALCVAAMPLMLLGVAMWLAAETDLSTMQSMALIGAAGTLIGGLAVWGGIRGVRTALLIFSRSAKEARSSLSWIRQAIKYSARQSVSR